MKKILSCFLIILTLFFASSCGINSSKEQFTDKENDLIQHANQIKIIKFDFADYVVHANGDYDDSIDRTDILFEIDDSKVEELKQKLSENIGSVPEGYRFESELDNNPETTVIEKYTTIMSGHMIKTVHVFGILYTQDNKTYFKFNVG